MLVLDVHATTVFKNPHRMKYIEALNFTVYTRCEYAGSGMIMDPSRTYSIMRLPLDTLLLAKELPGWWLSRGLHFIALNPHSGLTPSSVGFFGICGYVVLDPRPI